MTSLRCCILFAPTEPSKHADARVSAIPLIRDRFHALSVVGDHASDTNLISAAGNQWAKRAEYLLLANFGKISVQRLMVSGVLVYLKDSPY